MQRLNELQDIVNIVSATPKLNQIEKGQVVRESFSFQDFETMVAELKEIKTAMYEAADKLWLSKWYSNDKTYTEVCLKANNMIMEAFAK